MALAFVLLWLPVGAQQRLNHAGLVVRTGDGRLTYAYVAFPEASISGIELLRRSGIPLVSVPFGGLGEGVCSLEGEGCAAGECRRRLCQGPQADDPYWQYFRQEAPGDWRWLVLGPSATEVRDGDVDGWSWTAKDPMLPAVTIADVARLAGVDDAAASSASGTIPTPAVRTVYPPGAGPAPEVGQHWQTYLGAAAILVVIGGGALYASRRRRVEEAAT